MTLQLDETLTDRLISAAREAGRSPANYAADLIGEALDDPWAEARRRSVEYEKTGEGVSLRDAMAELRADLEAHYDAEA